MDFVAYNLLDEATALGISIELYLGQPAVLADPPEHEPPVILDSLRP
jgi:hypothetical protein